MIEMGVNNIADDTQYGYDVTEDGQRVMYYIQSDIFGNGASLAIWNPSNVLQHYKSFKEALAYLAVAREKKMFQSTVCKIVRTLEYSPRDLEIVEAESEEEYYA